MISAVFKHCFVCMVRAVAGMFSAGYVHYLRVTLRMSCVEHSLDVVCDVSSVISVTSPSVDLSLTSL